MKIPQNLIFHEKSYEKWTPEMLATNRNIFQGLTLSFSSAESHEDLILADLIAYVDR
jgi:hypothetical protein